MLDLRLIRDQTDLVRAGIAKLYAEAPIDEILALDARRRATLGEVEGLKAERKEGSKRVKQTKDNQERTELIAATRSLGDRIDQLDAVARTVDADLHHLLL